MYKRQEQSLVQQQYEVHTTVEVLVAIDALDYEYNHDARTQSPRLSAARLQLAVGRPGLGPRDQGEQCTQRASFVARYRTRIYTTAAKGNRAGLGFLVGKKYHVELLDTSLCGQTTWVRRYVYVQQYEY